MNATPLLRPVGKLGLEVCQEVVADRHYLRRRVDQRCMPEAYTVSLARAPQGQTVGVMIVGRPEATRCYPWYGSVEDARTGRAEVTRWQVLNLARVWLTPDVQPGGWRHRPDMLPGFTDRKGVFRSTLASEAVRQLADQVVVDYLIRRPPCFLEEPYELRWLLSYCDTRIHRGTLYKAAGFELYRTNRDGIQTWRLPLRSLTQAEDAQVRAAAAVHPRSRAYRERRTQLQLLPAEVA